MVAPEQRSNSMKRILRSKTGRRAGVLLATVAAMAVAVDSAAASPRHGHHARGLTTVTLNQATIGAVVGLGLTPAAVAPGTLGTVGTELQATFPIRGRIEHGIIRHRGGLSFTSGSTTLSLTRYTIDTNRGILTARAAVNGTRVGRITLFDLGAAPAQDGCAATATLALDAQAASALVSVFSLSLDPAAITGLDFGTACVAPAPRHGCSGDDHHGHHGTGEAVRARR
jgi:hypothetical protein